MFKPFNVEDRIEINNSEGKEFGNSILVTSSL